MTFRALICGLLLGLLIASFTYFNDQVIGQTFFIGNHLPASVFGIGLLLLLVVNPLLRIAGERWPFRAGEVAIILAMGLATCGWPGSNLMRFFSQLMVLPVHQNQARPDWLASNVMSYIPGQSPLLAPGYITDWPAFAAALKSGDAEDGPAPLRRIWQHLEEPGRWTLRRAQVPPDASQQRAILRAVNRLIEQPGLYDAAAFAHATLSDTAQDLIARQASPHGLTPWEVSSLNRELLEAALPGIRSRPRGSGVLLEAGPHDPRVVEELVTGGNPGAGIADVPWAAWWPTLRLWGGSLLLIGLATLCLIVIVHPQWTQRELLRYPIVEFVREVTHWSPGRWLPDIAASRLFWLGLVPVVAMHTLNSLSVWFPDVGLPAISRELTFDPLRTLFPNASRVPGSDQLFHPFIYPSVIGFGFFITTRVSLSIGLSLLFWVMLGGWLIAQGIPLDNNKAAVGANGTALRFGAYVGMTAMILYFGRRYYLRVLMGSVGWPRRSDTPAYAIWAARGMAICAALAVYILTRYGGMSPTMGLLLVAMLLMMLLVLARINVETGLFYAQPDWLPGVMLAGLFGVSGLGAEMLVLLLIASQVFAADPREGIAPYLANGLRMGDRVAGTAPRRLAPVLAGMIALGLIVSIGVTLTLQYGRGFNPNDLFAHHLPLNTIGQVSQTLTQLDARGEIADTTRRNDLGHLRHARPDATTVRYASLGLVLVVGCAVARLRLPWWPLHPVLFLVWGTYPANFFAFSFLLAAAIKAAVTRVGGSRAYTVGKPFMVGLIAGDVLAIIAWSIIGTIYYFATGLTPPGYLILPV